MTGEQVQTFKSCLKGRSLACFRGASNHPCPCTLHRRVRRPSFGVATQFPLLDSQRGAQHASTVLQQLPVDIIPAFGKLPEFLLRRVSTFSIRSLQLIRGTDSRRFVIKFTFAKDAAASRIFVSRPTLLAMEHQIVCVAGNSISQVSNEGPTLRRTPLQVLDLFGTHMSYSRLFQQLFNSPTDLSSARPVVVHRG